MTPVEGDGDVFLMTAGIFAFALMLIGAVLMLVMGKGPARARALGRRVENLRKRSDLSVSCAAAPANSSIKRTEAKSDIPGMEKLAQLLPRRAVLVRRLERTGYKISLGTYAMICVTVGALVAFLEVEVMGLPLYIALFGGAGMGLGLPHPAVSYLIARRTRKFLSVFPEAVELIVRGIKSGLPISEEIIAVGHEIADPVGLEFRRVSDALRFGQTLEQAMWESAKRLDIQDFNFFVVSLSVQRETGGNLAETLENLAEVLRGRRQMKLKVRAMSSEARASALIIGSLPFVIMAILSVMAPAYSGLLFTDPRGQMIGVIALIIMMVGALVMAKMVRFEV